MMKRYLTHLVLGLTLIFLASLHIQAQNNSNSDTTKILIIHTNDMHAKIDNFGKLAYLADSLRKICPYVFLVSSGDNFTGNPVVDMVPDKGYPMIDLMNKVGFTVSAIGNHEFDLGQTFLNLRRNQAKFPFISCNIDAAGSELKPVQPFIIVKAGDIEIPFLGVIELGPNGLPDSHPDHMKGIKFSNGLDKALEYKWLKKQYGILIGVTHLGVDDDKKLAGNMSEFDLILGGHSHTIIDKPMIINGVLIVQAGSGLKYAGITTLLVYHKHIIDCKDKLVALTDLKKSNTEIQTLIDRYNINPELDQIIAVADEDITGASELGSLMCDAITSRLHVDIALQNIGGIRVPLIAKGAIRLKDIYRLDPFGNQVVKYLMKGDEISSLICNAFNREKRLDLEVSGLKYTINTDPEGKCNKVNLFTDAGKPLDLQKEYSVCINSYMAASYTFNHKDAGISLFTTTSQVLIDFLKFRKNVNYKGVTRISINN